MTVDLKAISKAEERDTRKDVRKHTLGEADLAGRMAGRFIRGLHAEHRKVTDAETETAVGHWMAHRFGCPCDGDGA